MRKSLVIIGGLAAVILGSCIRITEAPDPPEALPPVHDTAHAAGWEHVDESVDVHPDE